jgi:hypothetical protein
MESCHSKAVSQMIHYRLRRSASRVRKLTRCGLWVRFDPMSQHFVTFTASAGFVDPRIDLSLLHCTFPKNILEARKNVKGFIAIFQEESQNVTLFQHCAG